MDEIVPKAKTRHIPVIEPAKEGKVIGIPGGGDSNGCSEERDNTKRTEEFIQISDAPELDGYASSSSAPPPNNSVG